MRRMGGLKKYMPITFVTMIAGWLAISGFPLMAGFFSKDEILWKTWATSALPPNWGRYLWFLAAAIPLIPIGAALLFPSTTALLSRATHEAELGAAMGIAQTFAGISRLVAPLASTSLFQYVGHRSPALDLRILARTARLLVTGHGLYG